jgi:hypothetical protein
MSNLDQLLASRKQQTLRGVEGQSPGSLFYFTFQDTTSGRCQFTWQSPGNGVAVVEVWGASGSGSIGCCCNGGGGVPANSGAYSKKTVAVTSSSCICGIVGCSTQATGFCYSGRSPCSVACFFNTSNNTSMIAQGGFGSFTMCTTGTAMYCCLRSLNFCNTDAASLLPAGGAFCGIICNVGGPNGAVVATASGGDVNISGGISCARWFNCDNVSPGQIQYNLAISPGIYSSTAPTCVLFQGNFFPTSGANGSSGRSVADVAISSLKGQLPKTGQCWAGTVDCGCYQFSGCYYGGVGIPGMAGLSCANIVSTGFRGGHGAVKITFF